MTEIELSRFARALEGALGFVATKAYRRPFVTLTLVALMTVVAGHYMRGLRVDPDLVAFLPASFPSVQGLGKVKRRYGAVEDIVLVAEHPDYRALARFAEEVASKLSALPSVDYVDHRRSDRFFRDRALYFLETDDLEIVKARIRDRIAYEERKAHSERVDLDETAPPTLDLSDINAKYRLERATFGRLPGPYHVSEDRRTLLVFVKPSGFASDLEWVGRVVREVEAAIASLDPARYGSVRVELAGRFKKRIDQQCAVRSDLRRTTVVAFLLVLLYVTFHFRGVRAIPVVVLPLGIGLIWTLGAAAYLFETLNILTAFTGAILLGLGVDYGIHILERFEAERVGGRPAEEAVGVAFSGTGRAVVLAGLTTAAGFAGLTISEFRGFREFGIVASMGVGLVVAACVLCVPPFLRLSDARKKPRKPTAGGVFRSYARCVVKWSGAVFCAVTVAAFLLVTQAANLAFDDDFASLEDSGRLRSYALDQRINDILGRRQAPLVLLTDEVEDESPLTERIREKKTVAQEASTIQLVVAPSDLVPVEQDEKRVLLEEIRDDLERIGIDALPERDRSRFKQLDAMVRHEPFGRDDLPVDIKRRFRIQSGQEGGMVLVYPSVALSDGRALIRLARELRDLAQSDGQSVSVAGEAMVWADVLELLLRELPRVLLATGVLVFAALWALLGRLRLAVLCFMPAVVTVVTMLGAAPLLGIELNYLNLVLVPVLLGIAVDAGVHLVVQGGTASREHLVDAMHETGRSVWGAVLTTAMGFGALLFAGHPGLDSFGRLALVGLTANVVAAFVWLGALLALRHLRAERLAAVGLAGRFSSRLAADIATVGGAGYAKRAPGTFGALAGIPVAWLLSHVDLVVRLGVIAGLVGLAVAVAYRYAAGGTEDSDPQEIVVDELVGVLIPLAVVSWSWPWVVTGFVLFRFFDIVKPGPVGWVDRRVKNPAGVILDDVVAGVLAAAVLVLVRTVMD